MSEYKSEINKGAIFVNDRKGNEKAPIKTGKFVDEYGVIKNIAIWENLSKKGLKYESFIISDYLPKVVELDDKTITPVDDTGTNVLPF